MELSGKIVDILIQGGLAGVALTSLYINYKIVSNHINHATEESKRLEVAITKLTEFLEIKMK